MVRARNNVSNLNTVASLCKVFPLLQHFSTFSPRMYYSFAYWQSYGDGAGIQKQATFLNFGKLQSRGDLRGEFCKVASFSQAVCKQSSEDRR